MHGDNDHTLSRGCMEHIEAEANFAAGRLLFLQERFSEEARSSQLALASVRNLKSVYGNTLATTLWRYVESIGETPVIGMMTCHPHPSRRPVEFDPVKPCKHFIQSVSFQARFSKLSEAALFNAVTGYCGSQRGGMLGQQELVLMDDNGEEHQFYFETFFNRYDALTLGVYIAKEPVSIFMRSA